MDSDGKTNGTGMQDAPRRVVSRREFVTAASLASVAVTAGMSAPRARAQELTRVSEDDPTAKALNYVHDARKVDAAKRASTSFCNNCALYSGGADDEWGKCSIFPGKLVAGEGWCSAWAAKPQS
jgi:hypothetical protein